MAEYARTLHSFNAQVARFSEKSGIKLELLVRRLAIEIYTRVTLKTPVDTGRARASWNLARGMPDPRISPERARPKETVTWKGSAFRGIQVPVVTRTVEQAKAAQHMRLKALEAGKIAKLKGAKLVGRYSMATVYLIEPAYITNNLFYVIYLEHGSSQQAPNGMVAISLHEVEAGVRSALLAA